MIRWMVRKDFKEIIEIEQGRHTLSSLTKLCEHPKIIGLVIENDGIVVGYLFYKMKEFRLTLLDIAVHPLYRRMGYASLLIKKLKEKMVSHRRTSIACLVSEYNLDFQLCLRANNFFGFPLQDKVLFQYDYQS